MIQEHGDKYYLDHYPGFESFSSTQSNTVTAIIKHVGLMGQEVFGQMMQS